MYIFAKERKMLIFRSNKKIEKYLSSYFYILFFENNYLHFLMTDIYFLMYFLLC